MEAGEKQVSTMRRFRPFLSALSVLALALGLVFVQAPQAGTAAPAKGSSISGTVFSAAGTPLARATVVAYALPGLRAGCATSPHEWTQVAKATSGSTGRYTISGLAAGHYRIGVFPQNLATDSFGYRLAEPYADTTADGANVSPTVFWADDVVAPSTGRDVHLAVPASISGRVTDQVTGAGIAGVEVRAVSTGQWEPTYASTRTGSGGYYTLAGLPLSNQPDPVPTNEEDLPGTEGNQAVRYGMVMIDTAGWYQLSIWWIDDMMSGGPSSIIDLGQTPAATYDKVLSRSSRIAVTVVDTAGRPVKGLAVDTDTAFPYPPILTDSKGRAYLPLGAPGEQGEIGVRVTDYLGLYRTTWYRSAPTISLANRVPYGPDSETSVRIVVQKDAATVVGRVTYATGDPAPPLTVRALLPGATDQWSEAVTQSFMHCDGTFQLSGLWPAMAVELVVTDPEDQVLTSATVTPSTGMNFVGPLKLPAWVFYGFAADNDGNNLPGITVRLWSQGEEPAVVATTVTNDEGSFRLSLPQDPGMVWVSFTDESETPAWAGEFYYDVPYQDPASLDPQTRGAIEAVRDDNPNDATGAQVDAQLDPLPAWVVSGFVHAGDDGRELQGIQVDLYTFENGELVEHRDVPSAHTETTNGGLYKVSLPADSGSSPQLVVRFTDPDGYWPTQFFDRVLTDGSWPGAPPVSTLTDSTGPYDAVGARVDTWLLTPPPPP